ncbi:MAG: hypothetical protein J7M21_00325, partial [Planctomycetes bacterium]|nr:hypothetical protein [Planctomycetota bacterium]
MLLAVAARTDDQRRQAVRRVRSRLTGGPAGGEDNYHVRGAYRCALAALGDAGAQADVLGLLRTGEFSQRRAITALTLAGRLDGLDWLLWNPQVGDDDALLLLVDEQLSEVVTACTSLPGIDAFAADDLAAWQLEILRCDYAIRRGRLHPHLPRAASRPAGRRARRAGHRGSGQPAAPSRRDGPFRVPQAAGPVAFMPSRRARP